MKGSVYLCKFFKILSIVLFVFSFALYGALFVIDRKLNDNYKVSSGEGFSVDTLLPVKVICEGQNIKNVANTFSVGAKYSVEMKMFGIIPKGILKNRFLKLGRIIN